MKLHKQTQERTLYRFNLFNQLIKWKRVDSENRLIEGYTYSYDALNRRVSKTHITPSNTPNHPTQTTHHYLYDDENIIGILDANKELLASIVHDTATDTPLSITTYQNEAKEPSKAELYYHSELTDEELLFLKKKNKRRTYYYHRDHQGSITHLSDEEGKVVESFTYDAYGIILEHTQTQEHPKGISSQAQGTLNPYGYTGREFDVSVADDTGIIRDLYYYRARYYDPMQGRFISQDPIEFLAGDVNFYRYVGGDPVNFVDPSGLVIAMDNHATMTPTEIATSNKNYMFTAFNDSYKKSIEARIKAIKSEISKKVESVTSNKNGLAVKGNICAICAEQCKNPPPIKPTPGSCDYYKKRQESFQKRFAKCKGCGDYSPPDYYMNYGYKYCTEFKEVTFDQLSPAGQKWLTRTLKDLQVLMEEGLKSTSECDNEAMRQMAFDSHVPAYNPQEMADLPLSDLAKIGTTPDAGEWLSLDTWKQAFDVGLEVGADWIGL